MERETLSSSQRPSKFFGADLNWILIVAGVTILIVFGLYFGNFSGGLSAKNEVWGTFGDFVGGVLNPAFSLLALIALLRTIQLQVYELACTREELRKTAEANELQAACIAGQQKRDDLFRLIQKVSERINRNFNNNVLDERMCLQKALLGELDINKNQYLYDVYIYAQQSGSRTKKILGYIQEDLLQMKLFLDRYEVVSAELSGPTPIIMFYKREYEDLVLAFCQLGLFEKELAIFYCGWPEEKQAA